MKMAAAKKIIAKTTVSANRTTNTFMLAAGSNAVVVRIVSFDVNVAVENVPSNHALFPAF
jgi:hypothetical protein